MLLLIIIFISIGAPKNGVFQIFHRKKLKFSRHYHAENCCKILHRFFVRHNCSSVPVREIFQSQQSILKPSSTRKMIQIGIQKKEIIQLVKSIHLCFHMRRYQVFEIFFCNFSTRFKRGNIFGHIWNNGNHGILILINFWSFKWLDFFQNPSRFSLQSVIARNEAIQNEKDLIFAITDFHYNRG